MSIFIALVELFYIQVFTSIKQKKSYTFTGKFIAATPSYKYFGRQIGSNSTFFPFIFLFTSMYSDE